MGQPESRVFHASVERVEKPDARSPTIDAASTRLMNESTGQRTARGLEAYRCFRIFGFFSASPTLFRHADCALPGDPADRYAAGFVSPKILKYRDYTIRRSNLIENEGATLIYGLPTLV